MMDPLGHKIHVKPENRCMMEINQQIKLLQLGCEIRPVRSKRNTIPFLTAYDQLVLLIYTLSTAPSETSKTEYGSVQEQEDKVPENFSDEEISDASSNDNP